MLSWLKVLAELGKVRITIAVTLSTLLGYVMFKGNADSGFILPVLGLWLLAMGSAALNHYQERELDTRMERTRQRPIPSGRISARGALMIAFVWSLAGSILLLISSGLLAMQLGLLALLWYNALYTPLKKKTPFAVIPGSAIGAIPPMVGWVAAGGELNDPKILITATFFFMWQIPHFWLLLQRYGEQYRQAGFPTLFEVYSREQVQRITAVWMIAVSVMSLMIPFFDASSTLISSLALFLGSSALIYSSVRPLFVKNNQDHSRRNFIFINLFLLYVMLVLGLDSFFR